MEFVVAKVEGGVDGFEGLEMYAKFLIFAFVCQDCSNKNHEPVIRHLTKKYNGSELILSRPVLRHFLNCIDKFLL